MIQSKQIQQLTCKLNMPMYTTARLEGITKTRLFKYIENVTTTKWKKKSDKNILIVFIFLLKT